MRLRAILFGVALSSAPAFGQGTVDFRNDPITLSSPPDRLVRFCCAFAFGNPFPTNNAPAAGTNFQVQLYYGASTAAESTLIPVTVTPARLRASNSTGVGIWTAGGMRTLNGFDFGSTVKLQVRVWDINSGTTYEQAHLNGGVTSKSTAFLQTIPPSSSTDFTMQNFTSFSIGFDEPFPSGPQLFISQPNPAQIQVAWRTNFSDYGLEAASSFPSTWTTVTNNISIQGLDFVFTENVVTQRFFRLRKP